MKVTIIVLVLLQFCACTQSHEAPGSAVLVPDIVITRGQVTEPQYESDDFYAVTAFALTLDEAAKKATRFMIDYLVD